MKKLQKRPQTLKTSTEAGEKAENNTIPSLTCFLHLLTQKIFFAFI